VSTVEPPIPPEEELRELAVQAAIHLSSVLRVAAVYDSRDHIVQIQIDKLERTLREILRIIPGAMLTSIGSELYLNDLRVPSRASQYKFIRTVLDEFARREMAGIRFAPGFEREELNHFLDEFLRSGVTGTALLDACRASGEGHVLPLTRDSTEGFDESDDELGLDLEDSQEVETPIEAAPDQLAERRRHEHALRGVRSLIQALHRGELEFRHAKRIVQPIVEAGADDPAWTNLAMAPEEDYAAAHALNVCSLASSIGRLLGLDRRGLSDLGVAALLHDVGTSDVAEIPRTVENFTDEDWSAVHAHCNAGAKLIARSTGLSPTSLRCVRVAIEHHMAPGPLEAAPTTMGGLARGQYLARTGYPQGLAGRPMSVLSQIVAVADMFVGFAMPHGDGLRRTPPQALELTLAECRGRFEDALIWALIHAVRADLPASTLTEGRREAA
jgi:HD-GYP domain-containing protein (c-di-GMP phosphodiesterase class II)